MEGTFVDVYFDPFTEKMLEGRASIIEVTHESDMFYTCLVQFVSDGSRVMRKILKK